MQMVGVGDNVREIQFFGDMLNLLQVKTVPPQLNG
jgi:hypothetical protein